MILYSLIQPAIMWRCVDNSPTCGTSHILVLAIQLAQFINDKLKFVSVIYVPVSVKISNRLNINAYAVWHIKLRIFICYVWLVNDMPCGYGYCMLNK